MAPTKPKVSRLPTRDSATKPMNDCCNDQVNEKVDAEAPHIVTQFDGDSISENKREGKHDILLLSQEVRSKRDHRRMRRDKAL